jgi:hypothetical protein
MPSSHLIDPRQNDRFGYCEDPTRALTSELPPITDMVRPGGNAFRLPGAAKSLSVFEKKSQMARRVFSRRVLRDVRDGRWSEGRRARGWSRLTLRLRTADPKTFSFCVLRQVEVSDEPAKPA